jgi:hypothetical protein
MTESLQSDGTSVPVSVESLAPVSKRFVLVYTLAFLSTILLFLAPLLGTLALKIKGALVMRSSRFASRSG